MAQQSEADRELMRHWVERWKLVGPQLEEIRRLFPETRFSHLPKRTTSGLIEQQAWFAKLRQ